MEDLISSLFLPKFKAVYKNKETKQPNDIPEHELAIVMEWMTT